MMFCNLTRIQSFPMAIKSCLQFSNTKGIAFSADSSGLVTPRLHSIEIARNFSSFSSQKFGNQSSSNHSNRGKTSVGNDRSSNGDSLWVKPVGERANRSPNGRNDSVRFRSNGEPRNRRRDDDRRINETEDKNNKATGNSIWVANNNKPEKTPLPRVNRSSWERQTDEDNSNDIIVEEEEEEIEEPENTKWSEIKNRFNRYDVRDRDQPRDSAAYRNWNRQESWGRKTWQEATESSVPKLIGEVVYGVNPVLAALSVGRREFYSLYVQEGLDLNNNNKKKKDKKGFEKVLKLSEKLGLTVKETSKHDLNMVSDNRPHQGLVLDASPLELVKVKELDPVPEEERSSSVWVALDEVTDPQNLGAIIRSAYFFGVTGVVVCAKNSAPLSAVVSKASAGSLEVMELRYCKNMMQFLEGSVENGWRVVGGSVSSKAVELDAVLPGGPTILVLGNEGTGLRPLVERSCTELVRISGNMGKDVAVNECDDVEDDGGGGLRSFVAVESLNVSVAAGLFLHHLIGSKA